MINQLLSLKICLKSCMFKYFFYFCQVKYFKLKKIKTMKRFAFVFGVAFVASLALSSCKKDYTCDCSYTAAGITVSAKTELLDAKKKDAEEACDLYETQLNFLGTGATCTLK